MNRYQHGNAIRTIGMKAMAMRLMISCEHGGNDVPARWHALFAGSSLLETHRGYDPGTLEFAKELASKYQCPLQFSTITRLLVDLNRSMGHPHQFSTITQDLPTEERQLILNRYYVPYRQEAERRVREMIDKGERVLHLSLHSFTPVMAGVVREAEISILYDPARKQERLFAQRWREALVPLLPDGYRVRFNYPYRGTADGLTTSLRGVFTGQQYLGIELEVNQKLCRGSKKRWEQVKKALAESMSLVIA